MLINYYKNYTETKIATNSTLDLSHFKPVSDQLNLSNEQVFVIGYYFMNELIPNIWMNGNL